MAVYSTPAMATLLVPVSALAKKVPKARPCGDTALDFIKAQQRAALVETVDMLAVHAHIRQAVRDYAHGLLTAATQSREAIREDHFDTSPGTMGKVDEEWVAGYIVKTTKLTWGDVSKCRAFDSKFGYKFWLVLTNSIAGCKLPEECKAKPVMARIADSRVHGLGNVFAQLNVRQGCLA